MLTSRSHADEDPLSRVLAPPPNETLADRDARLHAEAEAKRISDAIDEEIQQQQKAEKKTARPIKILLLGASGSDAYMRRMRRALTTRHH